MKKKIIIIFLVTITTFFYYKKIESGKELSNKIFLTLDEKDFLKTLKTEEEVKVFFKLKEDGVVSEIENGKEHFIKKTSNVEKKVIDSYITYLGIKTSPFINLENFKIEEKKNIEEKRNQNSKIFEQKNKALKNKKKEKKKTLEEFEKFE